MRILFLTHRLPYAPNRGDRIRAFHLIRTLAPVADVHLISLVHDAEEWSHRHDLATMTASTDVVRVRRLRRLGDAALALPGRRPLTHVLLHAPEIDAVIRRRLIETPPDVVLAYCSGMARYACEPALQHLPFVLDLVDVDSEKWRQLAERASVPLRWVYRREARLLRRFEGEAVRRAAATTVVSERERQYLASTEDPSVHVVRNGIDIESFKPHDEPAAAPRVVFCGVFNYSPNERAALWFAREVWPAVVRARPDARLTLVGMHPTSAVRRLERDRTIEVTGSVPDVRPYLWRSSVAVAPLDVARGVQNKVLEAIAAGLPVVVTPPVAEGLPANSLEACLVADAADAFSAAVIRLLSMPPAERRQMSGRAGLEALSWERQLAPMRSLLQQAAASRSDVR